MKYINIIIVLTILFLSYCSDGDSPNIQNIEGCYTQTIKKEDNPDHLVADTNIAFCFCDNEVVHVIQNEYATSILIFGNYKITSDN